MARASLPLRPQNQESEHLWRHLWWESVFCRVYANPEGEPQLLLLVLEQSLRSCRRGACGLQRTHAEAPVPEQSGPPGRGASVGHTATHRETGPGRPLTESPVVTCSHFSSVQSSGTTCVCRCDHQRKLQALQNHTCTKTYPARPLSHAVSVPALVFGNHWQPPISSTTRGEPRQWYRGEGHHGVCRMDPTRR